jgi:hypothetical protein
MKEGMTKDELIEFGGNHFNTPLIKSVLVSNIKSIYRNVFLEK